MELETKRLFLREPEVRDAQAYTRIHNSTFVLRFNAMEATTPERMTKHFADPEKRKNMVLLVEKQSGILIGVIFLEEDTLRYGVASKSLSYFIREEDARRGYMKEALHAVIAYLFQTQNLECISARAFAPNVASRALLRALGFTENGMLPHCVRGYGDVIYDDVIYTLLRQDFH